MEDFTMPLTFNIWMEKKNWRETQNNMLLQRIYYFKSHSEFMKRENMEWSTEDIYLGFRRDARSREKHVEIICIKVICKSTKYLRRGNIYHSFINLLSAHYVTDTVRVLQRNRNWFCVCICVCIQGRVYYEELAYMIMETEKHRKASVEIQSESLKAWGPEEWMV